MLKSPKGMAPETKYDYQAIAEEDAALQKGVAFIKSVEDVGGIKAYRILNDFKGQKFISMVSEKSEVVNKSTGPIHYHRACCSIFLGNDRLPASNSIIESAFWRSTHWCEE